MGKKKIIDILSPFFIAFISLILVSAAGLLLASALTGIFVGDDALLRNGRLLVLLNIAYYVFLLLWQQKSFRFDEMRFPIQKETTNRGLTILAVLLGFAALWVLGFLFQVLGLSDFYNVTDTVGTGTPLVLALVESVLLAPVAEEMIFRGMIYRRAKYYFNPAMGMFLSSLLFGIYHMNVVQGLYAFLAGIVLASVYEKTGRLRAAVIVHAANNLVVLLASAFF